MQRDRWNPRIWLRDWLNKPSKAEAERADALCDWSSATIDRIHGKPALRHDMDADGAEAVRQTRDEVLRLLGTDPLPRRQSRG